MKKHFYFIVYERGKGIETVNGSILVTADNAEEALNKFGEINIIEGDKAWITSFIRVE